MPVSNDGEFPKTLGESMGMTNGAIREVHGATSHRRKWIQVDLSVLVDWAQQNPDRAPFPVSDLEALMPKELRFVDFIFGKKAAHNELETHKCELRAQLARAFLGKSYIIENALPGKVVLAAWNGETDIPAEDDLLPWTRG